MKLSRVPQLVTAPSSTKSATRTIRLPRAPSSHHGHQFAPLAVGLTCRHSHAAAAHATRAPFALNVTVAQQARNPPDAFAHSVRPEPAHHVVAAAPHTPPAAPFTCPRPHHKRRQSRPQRNGHSPTHRLASRHARNTAALYSSTGFHCRYGHSCR